MLTKRIIPCLDVKDGRVVKGINFFGLQDAGDPVELGVFYDEAGADELVFLDITASHERRKTVVEMVEHVAEEVFIPFTVGGGISTVEDIKAILRAGADKVSINSAAVKNPGLIREGAENFGSQCIVLAVDARRKENLPAGAPPQWEVYIEGGRVPTGMDVLEWIKTAERLGAGEILLTSMDADGTRAGYDNELNSMVAASINIPLIASGGAGSLEHLRDAIVDGKADAVLAASIFHYKRHTIQEAKEYLAKAGIPIRMTVKNG